MKKRFDKAPFFLSKEDIDQVDSLVSKMNVDEKIGQLFCLVTYAPKEDEIKETLDKVKPGAIMFRPMAIKDAIRTRDLIYKYSKIPMLIAANIEAGGNGIVTEGTKVGCEMQIAATSNPEYAYQMGVIAGKEAREVGCNWAFGPIADIDLNFRNPITNTRTFGSNPKTVAAMSEAYIKGVQDQGLAATFKHFPGDGVDERDQHLVTSVNDFSFSKWSKTYGMVYKRCIKAGALTCMVGHIVLPRFMHKYYPDIKDEDMLPASLSKILIGDLLKKRLGFNGLVVTDASTMAGMCSAMSREKLVPTAIAAGADMFLFTRNLYEDLGFMKEGVKSGIISSQRLDEAVKTIVALKVKLGLFKKSNPYTYDKAKKTIGCNENLAVAEEVADKSITLVKNNRPGVLPISPKKYPRVLLYSLESQQGFAYTVRKGAIESFQKMLETEGFKVTKFNNNMGYEGRLLPESYFKDNFDLIIYVANIGTRSNQTTVRIEWAMPMGINVPIMYKVIPTIFISIENPYHLLDVPRIPTFINTYSATDTTLKALVEKLMGRSEFAGHSPSDPFCGKWDTHL
jgi:beta-N-acetylhexosaminidase